MAASLISPSTLARYQRVSESLLLDTCQILRATVTDDGRGGQTDSWNVSSTVACRLMPFKGSLEGLQAGGVFVTVGAFFISLPSGTDVTPKDRIKITTKNNRTFEVKHTDGPKTFEVALRAYCTELT